MKVTRSGDLARASARAGSKAMAGIAIDELRKTERFQFLGVFHGLGSEEVEVDVDGGRDSLNEHIDPFHRFLDLSGRALDVDCSQFDIVASLDTGGRVALTVQNDQLDLSVFCGLSEGFGSGYSDTTIGA
jgi:hypothetical protein